MSYRSYRTRGMRTIKNVPVQPFAVLAVVGLLVLIFVRLGGINKEGKLAMPTMPKFIGSQGASDVSVSDSYMDGVIQFTRACMIKHLTGMDPKMMWSLGLEESLNLCGIIGNPYVQTFRNPYDAKRVLRMNPDANQCTFVTLGVGQKVQVEVAFKKQYPFCDFFGADPVDEGNKKLYEQVGTFYNFAVSGGNQSVSKLLTKGAYSNHQQMKAVPWMEFLEQHVQRKHLDFLMIDTEWGEYGLLPMLQGSESAKNGYKICQFDLEVHQPSDDQLTVFHTFLMTLLEENVYTIASSAKEQTPHFRFFAFNHRDPECTKNYYKHL